MIALLKNLYWKAEDLKGRKLYLTLILIFFSCIVLGLLAGYFNNLRLKEDEMNKLPTNSQVTKKYYQGKISYVNPELYPGEKISYVLTDDLGKDIILLKAKDQRLSIAEGLIVKVSGTISKTKNGSDVLNVQEVIIKSATN